VVIHGLASNYRSWDLTKERSIAEVLQQAGFDVWLLDLRGHGEALQLQSGERQRHGWSLDDYGAHDLHTAIKHIRTATETDKVAVIGHSMGGMVAAAYHGHHGDDWISALVVVGSPIQFTERDVVLNLGDLAMKVGALWRNFGMHTGAELLGHIPGGVPVHGEGLLFNPKNLAPEIRTRMLKEIVSPVSREEMQQFIEIFRQGRFVSADGTLDYVEQLSKLDVPFLAIAGSVDRIVPPSRVSPWVETVSSTDKTYIEVGIQSGYTADYGHLDLVMGDAAASEIHEPIATWLQTRLMKP